MVVWVLMKQLSKNEILRVAYLRQSKKEREKSGRVVLFGFDEVYELGKQLSVKKIFATDEALFEKAPRAPQFLCSKASWHKMSGFESERGIGMELEYIPVPMDRPDRLVIADGISDPGNLGTIIRTARALDFGGMILLPGTVHPLNDKVLRASKGLSLLMPYADDFDFEGYTIIAADSCGGPLEKIEGPLACLFGSESKGITTSLMQKAQIVGIPMSNGVESLNVAAAAAIVMYGATR